MWLWLEEEEAEERDAMVEGRARTGAVEQQAEKGRLNGPREIHTRDKKKNTGRSEERKKPARSVRTARSTWERVRTVQRSV